MVAPRESGLARLRPLAIVVCILMTVETVAFAVASAIHFGIVIALGPITVDDPFPGAAIPEGVIAVVLGVSLLSVLTRWSARWGLAFGATLFALLLTLYGLSVTASSGRTGDIIYHITVLVLSVVIAGLLLLPGGRKAVSG